jgi:hypothetical protein
MSTITNDATGNTPAELSEADRAAWLRIERALRGMRWWMLFLATVAGFIGGVLTIAFGVGLIVEGVGNDSRRPVFLVVLPLTLVFSASLLPIALLLGTTFYKIRNVLRKRDLTRVESLCRHQIALWFAMALCAASIAVLSMSNAALIAYARIVERF